MKYIKFCNSKHLKVISHNVGTGTRTYTHTDERQRQELDPNNCSDTKTLNLTFITYLKIPEAKEHKTFMSGRETCYDS